MTPNSFIGEIKHIVKTPPLPRTSKEITDSPVHHSLPLGGDLSVVLILPQTQQYLSTAFYLKRKST